MLAWQPPTNRAWRGDADVIKSTSYIAWGKLRKPRFLLGARALWPHFSRRCGRAARVPRGFRSLPWDSRWRRCKTV